MKTVPSRPLWPSDITIRTQSRALDLVWGDSHASISHRELRCACRCAQCEYAKRSGKLQAAVAEDVELEHIEPVGAAGLQFFFSDGHDLGIFPWAYLHQLAFKTG